MNTTVVVAFALAITACAPGGPGPSEPAGTIVGVVDYEGSGPGVLRVAAWGAFPPVGPPLAEIAIDAPSYPQPYQLRDLPPGRYFVLAMVDVDPDDGDRYRPRLDPGGTFGRYDSPAAVTTTATAPTYNVDIHLVAPAPGSPWDR